ncbi:MAG: LysM peptidoglycan-binding domain-containing protein [Actinomycetota bacterium]|nr:LysM peptidoglycan-binding domain-containing protein [Actinomycetota bacterium]
MELAMVLCAGVAAITLTFGVLSSLGALVHRLAMVRLPIPVRPIAVLLMMASLTAVFARPRPATATIAPPIVRLAGEEAPPPDRSEAPADEAETPISTPLPDRSAGTSRVGTDPTPSSTATYVVEPGDSLWRIAAFVLRGRGDGEPSSTDIARFWPAIYAENRDVIGNDPNLIFPGQALLIPEG